MLIASTGWVLNGCGDDADRPIETDHYAISEPMAIMDYGHSTTASGYTEVLAIDLSRPRAVYTEWPETETEEPSEPVDFWVADLDEATVDQGKALLTEDLVAKYESDSVCASATYILLQEVVR